MTSSTLSEAELRVYGLIAEGKTIQASDRRTVQRLFDAGLILRDGFQPSRYAVVDLDEIEGRLRDSVQQRLEEASRQLAEIPSLVAQLRSCRTERPRGAGTASTWIEGKEAVNAAIAVAIDGARHELMTAQPGPRPRKVIDLSTDRDRAAVERGVAMRTLYSTSSRSNPGAVDRVNLMTALGAHFRTLTRPFMRLVLVDREFAIVEDHADGRPSFEGAHLVRDRAACGYFAAAFDLDWQIGLDWHGDEPAQQPTITTPLQRTILRALCAGKDQQQIAKTLGYSAKTINLALSDLRTKLELGTVYQLVAWWMGPDAAAERANEQD
ncbi:LuxR C-terminal-related transcriptional regulator [Streptomyces sp. NPDC049949]|uniref:LuxR C-terminal-related transcriptional regulator n=1 Tax=Streptomyces sp. NPDC049949 TaxID=3154627 RepID=UPI0034433879